MKKKVIVSGAYGFLGRYAARALNAAGYEVYALGHGGWPAEEYSKYGIFRWISSDITYESLCSLDLSGEVHALVHCGGGSSVAYSVEHPSLDYKKTVESALAALEYIRRENPSAKFIYPSSTAVYGVCPDEKISTGNRTNPLSPYGYNKAAAELMCESYNKNYSVSCSIIRFFSIYGEGLKKQLLWDACEKIVKCVPGEDAVFYGTGGETRDWINAADAASLIVTAAGSAGGYEILNGGSGIKTTISESVSLLLAELEKYGITGRGVKFNGMVKKGDPFYYWADISGALKLGWKPGIDFKTGVERYVRWYVNECGAR